MSWASQKGTDLSLDQLNATKLIVSGASTLNTVTATTLTTSGTMTNDGMYSNGAIFALGGSVQINDCNGTNPYLDFACIDGNADNDVRIQCAAGVNTSIAGQGYMSVYAATGVSMNGPLTVPLIDLSGNLTVGGNSTLTTLSTGTIDVTDLSAESIVNNGTTTLNNTLLVNGSASFNGGNLQVNAFNGTSAYIDLTANGGNGDYDARIMASSSGNTNAGCGGLIIGALEGIDMDGPLSTTNVITPLINSCIPLFASGYGSVQSGVFLNSTCSPPSGSASSFTVSNTTFCNGCLVVTASTYSCQTFLYSAVSQTFNGIAGIKYTWILSLEGGGDDPQPNNGTINYIIH